MYVDDWTIHAGHDYVNVHGCTGIYKPYVMWSFVQYNIPHAQHPTRCLTVATCSLLPRAPGLSNWFCQSVVVVHKKFFITGDSESKSSSKRENNDEIRRILSYVYLVEHKAVLFSAFSTFF